MSLSSFASHLANGTVEFVGVEFQIPFNNFDDLQVFSAADGDMSVVRNRHGLAIREYVARLIATGQPLPCHPSRPRKLSVPLCAKEAGVSKNFLKDPGVRLWLGNVAAEIGVGPRLLAEAPTDAPLCAFREAACRHYERSLRSRREKTDGAIAAALNNFKTALNYAAGREAEFADLPALEALNAAVQRIWADKPEGAKNLKADLNRAITLHREMKDAARGPRTFSEILRKGMRQVGMTPYAVAKSIGMHPSTVSNWLREDGMPDPSHKAKLAGLERTLQLQPGELVGLIVPYRNGIGIGRIDRREYPDHVRAKPWLHGRIKRYLPPNYFELGAVARREAMRAAVERLDDMTTPERKLREKVRRNSYILKSFTPTLKAEFDDISSVFKSGQIPTSRRSQSARLWKPVTRDKVSNPAWRRVFGALSSGLIREKGTQLRIPDEHLTFALLLKPSFLRHVLAFKQSRNRENKAQAYITRNDLALVYFARSLCDPTDGWMKDHPGILDRLHPISGFLSEADITEMRDDFTAACERAYTEYGQIIAQRRRGVEPGTDSKAPVEQILRMANPLSALRLIVDGLHAQLESLPAESVSAATLQRRIVMVCLLAQLALRRNTMCQINVAQHLFKDEDGRWAIKMPSDYFKNHQSTHWGSRETTNFFDRRLKDRWGFYKVLEQYVTVGRKVLLAGAKSEALFVGARGTPTLTPARLGDDFRDLTEEFLAWNEHTKTGIYGVVPFGPHLVRHILATAVIKKTNGDYQAAADSIHDTIATVKKYYAVYLPGDRLERLDNAVDSVLDEEPTY